MTFAGTVAWMSPEMLRHEPCSEKVDVWSYGVLLWEMLTQEKPYNVSQSLKRDIYRKYDIIGLFLNFET